MANREFKYVIGQELYFVSLTHPIIRKCKVIGQKETGYDHYLIKMKDSVTNSCREEELAFSKKEVFALVKERVRIATEKINNYFEQYDKL